MLETIVNDCTGCFLCAYVCPTKAITIESGKCGYRYPKVDGNQCVECNKCNLFCPVQSNIPEAKIQKCYAAYTKYEEDLLNSTSGGVATELAKYYLNKGRIVYGVAYSADFKNAKHIRIDKAEDLKIITGTKYVQAEMQDVFGKLKNDIDNKREVMFIGLPCEIASISNFCSKDLDKILLCELVCHGPASPKTLMEYILYLEKRNKSKIISFNVRFKKDGWKLPFLRAVFANNSIFMKEFYNTEYGEAFYLQGRDSCYKCKFKGIKSKADITLGDFWGVKEEDEIYNHNGVSICFCHSKKAENLITNMKNLVYCEIPFEDAIVNNEDVISSRKIHDKTIKFTREYEKNGLIKSLFSIKSSRQKIRYFLQKIVNKI